jgi:D-glycero-alpha-D-manno-heptose-7-phosphate kinase
MTKQTAYSPTRIDLAGGTLDIWPLNMLVDRALTVNVAIDLWATAVIEDLPGGPGGQGGQGGPGGPGGKGGKSAKDSKRVEVRSEDQTRDETWESGSAPPADTKLPLIAECVRYFDSGRGFRITTRCLAPAGSGLGGSSSLAISILGGLQAFLGRPILPPDEMVRVARDLEARVLEIPTGTQDHVAATFGGAAAIRYGPGRPVRESLRVDLEAFGDRLVLAYGGASRLSAMANWDMVRRAIDKDEQTRRSLRAIAAIAHEMRAALVEGNFDAAGELMGREWEERKRLSNKVTTAVFEKAIPAAKAAGAVAGKVCGAGGGGCIAFICREGARSAVTMALAGLLADGLRILPCHPTRIGLQLAGT